MGTAAPNNIVDGVTFSMVGVKQPDYRHVLVSGKTPEGRKMLEEILRLRTLRIQAYRAQLPEADGRDAGDPISPSFYPARERFPILDLDPEHVLKELVLSNKFKSLPGMFANLGGRYVSEGVKAAIERLEKVAPTPNVLRWKRPGAPCNSSSAASAHPFRARSGSSAIRARYRPYCVLR